MSGDKRFSKGQEPLVVADRIDDTYDFVPSFTVDNDTTNYDLNAQQSDAFKNVPKAWFAIIWTDQDITIRFNSMSNPPIPIPAEETPIEFKNILAITNVYITNASGSAANVKVMLV